MNHRFLAVLSASFLALALLAQPAPAQPAPGEEAEVRPDADGTIDDGEAILNEAVEESGVTAEPDQQGMRATEPVEEVEALDLYALLQAVRHAPPGLDGQPVERPNAWASEPETEMVPQQPRDAFLFPPDYIE